MPFIEWVECCAFEWRMFNSWKSKFRIRASTGSECALFEVLWIGSKIASIAYNLLSFNFIFFLVVILSRCTFWLALIMNFICYCYFSIISLSVSPFFFQFDSSFWSAVWFTLFESPVLICIFCLKLSCCSLIRRPISSVFLLIPTENNNSFFFLVHSFDLFWSSTKNWNETFLPSMSTAIVENYIHTRRKKKKHYATNC